MNLVDWLVLLGTMVGIAAYGAWRTRHTDHLDTYLKGSKSTGWFTIGLSVMATQASAITFLSIPGQGFESGMGFVQNYFGLPLALIIVCAVFLPIYRKLGVYTAYEYLGKRFDQKTRLLGAGLFLLQRGLAAGVTTASMIRRELITGLATGLVIGGAFYIFAILGWGDEEVALAVAFALLAACAVATAVAMALPTVFQRLGMDPAFGSGPLATVIQDLLSIGIYFAAVSAVVG